MDDKQRISAIREAVKNAKDVPTSLADFLIIRGYSFEDAQGAINAWASDQHWKASDGTAWGEPKAPSKEEE